MHPQRNWRPKPFRPSDPPSKKETDRLLGYLKSRVSADTFGVFFCLVAETPFNRLFNAMQETLVLYRANPAASNAVTQLLGADKYRAYCEARAADLDRLNGLTAHRLLCLDDRQIFVSFLRRTPDLLKESHEHPTASSDS